MIMSQDRGAITFEDVEVCGQEAHEWAASSGFGKKDQKPSPAQILRLICKKGTKRNGVNEKEEDISQLVGQEARVIYPGPS